MQVVHRLARGFRATLPLAMGCVPFGLSYGAVAHQSLTGWQAQLMSVTVFAGTAQFVTASLLAQGVPHFSILVTALLVNLRLLLMSAALAPSLHRSGRALHPLVAHTLTDESFAVTMTEWERSPQADALYAIGSGAAIFVFWQAATFLGYRLATSIPAGFGLEFALPASLICLLFLLVRGRRAAVTVVLAGALAIAIYPLAPMWSVILATVVAATIGMRLPLR